MNVFLKNILSSLSAFFSVKKNRRLSYLLVLCIFVLADFFISGQVRRTFVFYSNIEGKMVVEDRMIHRSGDEETDILRYVEEALLGPEAPDVALLFPRETKLLSLMYRDSVVYANLTESAALPLNEGADVFRSLLTLNEGIRRNFTKVKDVRLFIGGNEVFFKEFSMFFSNSADNSKTAP
jgi:hypothetical protein